MAQHVSHPHLFQYTHYLLLEEPLWLLGTLRFTLSLSFCRHPHGAFHYLFLAFCRVSWYHLSNPLVLGLGIVLLQVDLLESERAFFDRERRSRERSRAIWNPTKDFFESLGSVQWHSLFNLPHERFLPHILWRKLWIRAQYTSCPRCRVFLTNFLSCPNKTQTSSPLFHFLISYRDSFR